MSEFRITCRPTPEQKAQLEARGFWPFPCGGVLFDETTAHECDNLAPFLVGNGIPKFILTMNHYRELNLDAGLYPWMSVEDIHSAPTQPEEPHGEADHSEV